MFPLWRPHVACEVLTFMRNKSRNFWRFLITLTRFLAVFKPFRIRNDQIIQGIDAVNQWKKTEVKNPEDMKYFCLIPPTQFLSSKLVHYTIFYCRNTMTWCDKTGRLIRSDTPVLGKVRKYSKCAFNVLSLPLIFLAFFNPYFSWSTSTFCVCTNILSLRNFNIMYKITRFNCSCLWLLNY